MARPREAQGEHLTMGGVGEEHLTIDIGRSANNPGGVTRSRFHHCPYTAKREARKAPRLTLDPPLWLREHGTWLPHRPDLARAACKLERAAPAGGAKRETARTIGPVTESSVCPATALHPGGPPLLAPGLGEVRRNLLAHGHALAQILLGEQPNGPDGHRGEQRAEGWLAERVAQHDQQVAQVAASGIVLLGHEASPRAPGPGRSRAAGPLPYGGDG